MVNLAIRKDAARAAGRQERQDVDERVYASLAHLIRMGHQASGFSFLPRQPLHSLLAGRHAAKVWGRGLSFEELRVYRPGDDIRSIDWKVTARTRAPHIRVFTEERFHFRQFVKSAHSNDPKAAFNSLMRWLDHIHNGSGAARLDEFLNQYGHKNSFEHRIKEFYRF